MSERPSIEPAIKEIAWDQFREIADVFQREKCPRCFFEKLWERDCILASFHLLEAIVKYGGEAR